MFLKSARQLKKIELEAPQSWLELDDPEGWKKALEHWLYDQDPVLFGHVLVSLGNFSVKIFQEEIRHVFQLSLNQQADIQASATALPFKKESLDWLFLPFTLEYSQDPHQLLREANYALRNDGYLLILMTHAASYYLYKRVKPRRLRLHPWRGRLFTPARVRDWLELLNFRVIHQGYLQKNSGFRQNPPKGIKEGRFGKIQLAPFSAGYCFIVQKKEWPLTLATQRAQSIFQPKKQVSFGFNKNAT